MNGGVVHASHDRIFFGQEIDRLLQSISWGLADQAFVLPQATTSLGCV